MNGETRQRLEQNAKRSIEVRGQARRGATVAGRHLPHNNSETRERLGQSAKGRTTVRGQAGRGATVAGRRLPGAVEQKVDFFCPCQVFWKIMGRSVSGRHNIVTLLPSCA